MYVFGVCVCMCGTESVCGSTVCENMMKMLRGKVEEIVRVLLS